VAAIAVVFLVVRSRRRRHSAVEKISSARQLGAQKGCTPPRQVQTARMLCIRRGHSVAPYDPTLQSSASSHERSRLKYNLQPIRHQRSGPVIEIHVHVQAAEPLGASMSPALSANKALVAPAVHATEAPAPTHNVSAAPAPTAMNPPAQHEYSDAQPPGLPSQPPAFTLVSCNAPQQVLPAALSGGKTTSSITSLHLTHLDASSQQAAARPMAQGTSLHDVLYETLDDMRDRGQLLFGKYEILSSFERRSGGQGCVQFVHDPVEHSSLAVKFFFKLEAFQREAALYADPVIRVMMAATRSLCANTDGVLRSSSGIVFPPHIVIERGEPLDEWTKRMVRRANGGEIPLVATFQALTNIAERLLLLHKAGYVHCDLKPSNVLWLVDMHAWTLIDFGSTCKAGMARAKHFEVGILVSFWLDDAMYTCVQRARLQCIIVCHSGNLLGM
jgi:hypothetical protein